MQSIARKLRLQLNKSAREAGFMSKNGFVMDRSKLQTTRILILAGSGSDLNMFCTPELAPRDRLGIQLSFLADCFQNAVFEAFGEKASSNEDATEIFLISNQGSGCISLRALSEAVYPSAFTGST
jgi:hypothetical protein